MNEPLWIWQQPVLLASRTACPLLRACTLAQGRLLGMLGAIESDTEVPARYGWLLARSSG